MLHKSLLFILLWFVAGIVFGQETLTIDQAIEIALKNNYDIRLAQNDAEIAHLNNIPGNAGMLPRVNATLGDNFAVNQLDQKLSNGTEIKKNSVTGNTLSPSLNLYWTLFDGLKMFATKKKLERLDEIGQLNLKDTLQTMIAQVIEAYFNVVSSQQQLRSINEAIKLYEETVKLTDKQFQVGTISKVTLLQAKVDLNANRSSALTQKAVILQNKAAFNLLLARPADTEFEVLDSIPFDENPALIGLNELDNKNFQIRVAQKNIEIGKFARKEVFSQFLPNLSLNGIGNTTGYGFTRTQNSAGFSLYNQTYGPTIGFTLTVPIFNGLIYSHQMKVADITIRNNQYKYEKISIQNKVNYYNALKNFEAAKDALKLEEENILLAKENADIAWDRFRLSESTALELRQAQQSYVDAMTRLVNSRYNAKTAETELMRIQGELVK